MADELLPYYNRELSYIRRLAAEFAETHPKVAARLRQRKPADRVTLGVRREGRPLRMEVLLTAPPG